MIFRGRHIEQIKKGEKTQTRRLNGRYLVGHDYCVQFGYGTRGVDGLRIKITDKRIEPGPFNIPANQISKEDAWAEGGYTVQEYEDLFRELYPACKKQRVAYTFEVIKTAA